MNVVKLVFSIVKNYRIKYCLLHNGDETNGTNGMNHVSKTHAYEILDQAAWVTLLQLLNYVCTKQKYQPSTSPIRKSSQWIWTTEQK